jgi:hypothetical protein
VTARRDILLILGLFLALVLFIAFGPSRTPPPPEAAPTTRSSAPEGAQVLYEWVGRMGYSPRRLEYRDFELDSNTDAFVILSPPEPITETEARITLDWVSQGGTLILADQTNAILGNNNALLGELDVDIVVYTGTTTIDRAGPAQPALDRPPVGEADVRAGRILFPRRDDYTVLLGARDAPLLTGIRHGSGYIYLSATSYPFTNSGLDDSENARMVINLLRRVPAGGEVLFDEIHHGYRNRPSTTTTIFGSPWGWGGFYAALTIGLYLILSGRRFGRPIPLQEEIVRRSSAEYVESMADLLQRGAKHSYVLNHYRQTLKRRIARPFGLNPSADDDEFIRDLVRARDVDEGQLRSLFARLGSHSLDGGALVETIAEADAYVQSLTTRNE